MASSKSRAAKKAPRTKAAKGADKAPRRAKPGGARKATRPGRAAKGRAAAAPSARIRLTADVAAGGSAGNLAPSDLRALLSSLAPVRNSSVLVGSESRDDAGVYRLSASTALVATCDFFAPMVDDPFVFGQIAAASALSDVYAMGGTPLVALGIAGFPAKKIPLPALARVLEGAAERVKAAGAVIVGGHSVSDGELKYGLAVTGVVHPKRFIRKGGAKAGDLLLLTKPLGTGIVCTGIQKRVAKAGEEKFAIASMVQLNDVAGGLLSRFGARACTDVSGLSLAGHATEMAEASGSVRIEIDSAQLPLLPGTARLAEDGYRTAGASRNRDWLGRRLAIGRDVSPALVEAVLDPQTSGGLLVSLPPRKAEALEEALHRKGLRPAIIGRVAPRPRSSAVVVAVS